jgi:hypothetical protein
MTGNGWLLLIHQIPPNPAYFRAKVARRLAQVGAVSIKNSVYVLPANDETLEDFQWIRQEVVREGGQAWLFRAEVLAGTSERALQDSFNNACAPGYEALVEEARALLTRPGAENYRTAFEKLSRRRDELERVDFFQAPQRSELDALMRALEQRLVHNHGDATGAAAETPGSTWVTRTGVKEDRIGSAWLIRRFIDPKAVFRYVRPDDSAHAEGEIRFDMFEGEFTHRGDLCTFEVLVADHGLSADPGLTAIAEIIHDIDLKDNRYQRPETAGVARAVEGLCLSTTDDSLRVERGAYIFEGLYRGLTAQGSR